MSRLASRLHIDDGSAVDLVESGVVITGMAAWALIVAAVRAAAHAAGVKPVDVSHLGYYDVPTPPRPDSV